MLLDWTTRRLRPLTLSNERTKAGNTSLFLGHTTTFSTEANVLICNAIDLTHLAIWIENIYYFVT